MKIVRNAVGCPLNVKCRVINPFAEEEAVSGTRVVTQWLGRLTETPVYLFCVLNGKKLESHGVENSVATDNGNLGDVRYYISSVN